jgi:glycosyltransferase involved in cell wall biosynthesis
LGFKNQRVRKKTLIVKNVNLHIYPSDMVHENRIFKQARFISKNYDFEKVILLGIWREGISKNQLLENKIQIKRISLLNIQNRSILYLYFFFYAFVLILLNRPSLVNIHTLEFLPVVFIAKIFKIKIIYDPHELETEKNNTRGLRKKLSKWLEYLLIKKADHIFVVSENIADWYEKTYNIPRPTVLLNVPRVAHVNKKNYFKDTFHLRDDQIILLYQGGLAAGRGVDILLEAFKKSKNDKIVIIFMGYGEFEKEIQSLSKSYNNIFFHKAVPTDEVLNYTASADVGVALIKNTCLSYNFCMPNKLFEYAMAGLPVIVSNVKEMSAFVKKYQMGVVVEDDTVASLNEAIERLLSMDLTVLKQNAKKAALDNSWEHQEEKMQIVYQKLLNEMQ